MDLSTVARVKTVLEESSTDFDALLGQFLAGVSAAVETYLQRRVEETTWTDRLYPEKGEKEFSLSAFPVVSVTSVQYEGTDHEYVIDASTGLLFLKNEIPVVLSYGLLEVVYVGGMAPDTAGFIARFPDVAQAVDLQTALLFQRRKTLGVHTLSDPGGSVTIQSPIDLTLEVKMALDKHVRIQV